MPFARPTSRRLPAELEIIGQAPAGKQFPGVVGPGEAVRIFTGAPVPEGADTILIQENARLLGDGRIEAVETVAADRHIRNVGLDFVEGDLLLERGRHARCRRPVARRFRQPPSPAPS